MKFYLNILILCGALFCTSSNKALSKTDLNTVLKQLGVSEQNKKRSNNKMTSHLSEAQKTEIRLINSFLEKLKILKTQIEKQEKELIDAKEKILIN
jgi:hypothetical protein